MSTRQSPALTELYRGMSFGFLAGNGYYASDEAKAQVDRMAELSIKWVALMATVMQESYTSTRMFRDFEYTPRDDELIDMIGRFHDRGIRVMLKPMIECHDSTWRGEIKFPPETVQQIQTVKNDYWTPWFQSLTDSLVHYGKIAQETNCEMLCLACELIGVQHRSDHWLKTIEAVRKVYDGPLTYDGHTQTLPEGNIPEWVKSLDVFGLSFYKPAAEKPGASMEEMVASLKPWVEFLKRASDELDGMPIYFAECGARSIESASQDPGGFGKGGKYDGQAQADYLEAIFRSFWDEPWWRGLFWWKWDEQQHRPHYHTDPDGETGFTLSGKPAAELMKKWYTRSDRA